MVLVGDTQQIPTVVRRQRVRARNLICKVPRACATADKLISDRATNKEGGGFRAESPEEGEPTQGGKGPLG